MNGTEGSTFDTEEVDDYIRVSRADVEEHLSTLTESKLRTLPDKYILFFWTYSAFFEVDQM